MGNLLEAHFKIINAKDCPLYAEGQEFYISGVALHPPAGKPACLFLAREIIQIVVEKMGPDSSRDPWERKDKKEFNCCGCTGLIKFAHVEEKKFYTSQMRMLAAAENRRQSRKMGSLLNMMNAFSFFQTLDEESLKDIFSCLTMKDFAVDEMVLRRGSPGKYLYFIVSGRVAVLDDDNVTIALLGRGEIFGEMSLFSGQPVCASIMAVDPARILMLSGKDLSQILIKYPFLQMAFTRLLIQRLAVSNVSKAETMSLAFTGQLTEIPPSELFQMLNENVKTGVVELDLADGPASVAFREGEIVRVRYRELAGEKAFYEILKAQQGRFKFSSSISVKEMEAPPVAAFMKLLMDGLRKIDEESYPDGHPPEDE
ncbi:MAG: cyclic nucleotide-binding domain-containing protein [Deltaproteobacteria bacterium]|nr:cyclic nucleotide-binding domain-containing protein [Deltaproteobacteria bacterium]